MTFVIAITLAHRHTNKMIILHQFVSHVRQVDLIPYYKIICIILFTYFIVQVECAKYDRNTQQFFDRYRINIGEESLPIIVSSLDLYRLHRVIERKPRNLSVSSNLRYAA